MKTKVLKDDSAIKEIASSTTSWKKRQNGVFDVREINLTHKQAAWIFATSEFSNGRGNYRAAKNYSGDGYLSYDSNWFCEVTAYERGSFSGRLQIHTYNIPRLIAEITQRIKDAESFVERIPVFMENPGVDRQFVNLLLDGQLKALIEIAPNKEILRMLPADLPESLEEAITILESSKEK